MIKIDDVSKELGSFHLEHISFELPGGYICGMAGQSGAGKTSLMHLILGLYKADDGRITINGMNYEKDEKKVRNMIGTVMTEDLFESNYSLRENADNFGKYFEKYRWEYMRSLLEQFHLDYRDKFGSLSKGQKLKAQFAFALSYDPEILILDEPAGNFDPNFRKQFFKIIQNFIKDENKNVILATHQTEDLDRIADYLIYLEKGKQIFAGNSERFREKYRIVTGEKSEISRLSKERIINIEETDYSVKALIKHKENDHYADTICVTYPSIEEFMYFFSRRKA